MPSVSVIISTYNRAGRLDQALKSVLAQTYRDFEIIVVDDGSTDHTRDTVGKYAGQVRYIYQENAGHASAKNAGVAAARGEYIAFLDDDDVWLPRKLELQVTVLKDHPDVDVIYGAGYKVWGDFRTLFSCEAPPSDPHWIIHRLLRGNFFGICSVMIRAKALRATGCFHARHGPCDDWDMWLRIAARGHRFAAISEPIWEYRFHDANMGSNTERLQAGRVSVLGEFFAAPETPERLKLQRNYYLSRLYVKIGDDYYAMQQFGKARTAWGQALRLDPTVITPALMFFAAKSLAGVRILNWARHAKRAIRWG